MKNNIEKLLVLITFSIFLIATVSIFWIDMIHPKKIEIDNGLKFGNSNSSVKVVVFEDFSCKFCKTFVNNILPIIKERYIDTNKISYMIVPLAYLYDSKSVANAAVIIYEMNKNKFFDFLKVISDENTRIIAKEDLMKIAKNIDDINVDVFKEFLQKEIFNNYLEDNLVNAKKILKPLQVPTVYINGNLIKINEIDTKIEELISYGEKNK